VNPPVRVILITDGDKAARRAMEFAAKRLGLRCISASAGNPTPLRGWELVALINKAAYDPVLVMVDDKGNPGLGAGESALAYLCRCEEVQVLGAIAVASNTRRARGTPVDVSITRDCRVIDYPVDKYGLPDTLHAVLQGDTVDVLRDLNVPVVVGIGDPGKMNGADKLQGGCEVTTKAIVEVLSRTLGHCPGAVTLEPPHQPTVP
jgi:stage V sporulation protein AE